MMLIIIKPRSFFYFLLLPFIFLACKDSKPEEPSSRFVATDKLLVVTDTLLPLEVQIYLPIHEVDSLEGLHQIDSLQYYAMTQSGALPQMIISIDSAHFNPLIDGVVSHSVECTDSGYVSALKLYFGMRNDSIVQFYQPLLLCKASQTVNGGETWATFNTIYSGNIYQYGSNGFVNALDTGAMLREYRQQIQLKDSLNGVAYHPFVGGNTDQSSVQALIFPFQVIKALIHDNQAAVAVRVWNAVRKIPANNYTMVKHGLLMSSRQDDKGNFKNRYADMAHLCPPNCSALVYRLR